MRSEFSLREFSERSELFQKAFISNGYTLPVEDMIPVQVRVTKKLIELLDELVDNGIYSNRSEAIRDAIRKHLNQNNSI